MEFRVVFSSAVWFGTEFRMLLLFLFQEQNSELFSLPWNGSELNSESLLLFLYGTEFRVFFSSAEWLGTEFREFSVQRNTLNSARTNQLFRLFRLPQNNFLSEIPNPTWLLYSQSSTKYYFPHRTLFHFISHRCLATWTGSRAGSPVYVYLLYTQKDSYFVYNLSYNIVVSSTGAFFRLQRSFKSTNVLAFVHKKFESLLGGLGEREEDEKS